MLAWLGLTVPTPSPMLHHGSLYPPLLQVSDFLHSEGKVSLYREEVTTRQDSSLLSSLYSYWLLSNDQSGKALTPSEIKARKTALKCIQVQCYIDYHPCVHGVHEMSSTCIGSSGIFVQLHEMNLISSMFKNIYGHYMCDALTRLKLPIRWSCCVQLHEMNLISSMFWLCCFVVNTWSCHSCGYNFMIVLH